LEPSLHFESCFSGIQLLVVEEPSPVACVAHNIFGETPEFFSYLTKQAKCVVNFNRCAFSMISSSNSLIAPVLFLPTLPLCFLCNPRNKEDMGK
jgi:hypothetical protein